MNKRKTAVEIGTVGEINAISHCRNDCGVIGCYLLM